MNSKHNLEPSLLSRCFFPVRIFWIILNLSRFKTPFYVVRPREHISQKNLSENVSFIQEEVKAQDLAGADYIDINAGTFVGEEAERLKSPKELFSQIKEPQ